MDSSATSSAHSVPRARLRAQGRPFPPASAFAGAWRKSKATRRFQVASPLGGRGGCFSRGPRKPPVGWFTGVIPSFPAYRTSNLGVTSISIRSRDPNLSRKPPKNPGEMATGFCKERSLKRTGNQPLESFRCNETKKMSRKK